ncbi:MAG: hypothetical protein ACHQXA_08060, partial [Gemmatimonadales bacterium]
GGGSTGPDTIPHAAGTHAYLGAMAGRVSHNGVVTLVIADTGAVSPVNGSYKPIGGAAVTMGGTLTRSSGALSFGGGGYGATGLLAAGTFTGHWTITGDSGSFAAVAGSGTPLAFCGTFSITNVGKPNNSGVAVLLLNGAAGWLVAANRDTTSNQALGIIFPATRSGNTVTITPDKGTVTGTISGTSISGTITDSNSAGTFSANAGNCTA